MVSDAGDLEAAAIRNYLEQCLVREALTVASCRQSIRLALDVGAGYGRLSRVLAEFALSVCALERDPQLLQIGKRLNPQITFLPISSLDYLPLQSAEADFALTFTVLQHLPDELCLRVLEQLKRVVEWGHILLVEETDETTNSGSFQAETGLHWSRSVGKYSDWMAPWELIQTWPRRIEPTYPRQEVGTAMLFSRLRISTEAINPHSKDRLELGCGANPTPGFLHHDKKKHSPWVDVGHDLDILPWPFPDGGFAEVLARDVMEHLRLDIAQWLNEVWRILRPGGILVLQVPSWDNENCWTDPTHRRGFAHHTFDYWDLETFLGRKHGQIYFGEHQRWWRVLSREFVQGNWCFRLQKRGSLSGR